MLAGLARAQIHDRAEAIAELRGHTAGEHLEACTSRTGIDAANKLPTESGTGIPSI